MYKSRFRIVLSALVCLSLITGCDKDAQYRPSDENTPKIPIEETGRALPGENANEISEPLE